VVGLFGVIGSLIFVGLQMKQDQEIARSAAYQARSQQITALQAEMASEPGFRSGYMKSQSGRSGELTPDERTTLNLFSGALLNFYENVHYQYTHGFLDDEHWGKSRNAMKNFFRSEKNREQFRSKSRSWRESFRVLLEELIAEIDAEDGQ
jgi:hypothetical protein